VIQIRENDQGDAHFFLLIYSILNYPLHNLMFFWLCIMNWLYRTLITNVMHQLLFIHTIIFSSTRFEPQVLIFRRIQLYTRNIWYCQSLWEFLVANACFI